VYFSAHWCPPCRGFTPHLAKAYTEDKGESKIAVIFLSSDRDQTEFEEYLKEMPWYALPHAEREKKAELSKTYGIQGIPSLLIFDGDGNFVMEQGVQVFAKSGASFENTLLALTAIKEHMANKGKEDAEK